MGSLKSGVAPHKAVLDALSARCGGDLPKTIKVKIKELEDENLRKEEAILEARLKLEKAKNGNNQPKKRKLVSGTGSRDDHPEPKPLSVRQITEEFQKTEAELKKPHKSDSKESTESPMKKRAAAQEGPSMGPSGNLTKMMLTDEEVLLVVKHREAKKGLNKVEKNSLPSSLATPQGIKSEPVIKREATDSQAFPSTNQTQAPQQVYGGFPTFFGPQAMSYHPAGYQAPYGAPPQMYG
jgi:hypothetical protein